ncbi:MAG: DUF4446 family protein [Tissierellia bacterium]|nr:DUF4446 family protein [Tissierellia bacterium]
MANIISYIGDHISSYNTEVLIVLAIGLFVLLILNVLSLFKIRSIKKQYNKMAQGMKGINLEELLIHTSQDLDGIKDDIVKLDENIQSLRTKLTFAIQKVGFMRYNAFGDMGSDLSFSIALLDNFSNGFVLTSIYGRDNNVCYAKPIILGKSKIQLSSEEIMVIDKAIKGMVLENSI